MRRQRIFLLLAATVALLVATPYRVALSQEGPEGWSQPALLFEGEGWTQYNALAAAPDGRVHAFWQSDPTTLGEGLAGKPGSDNLWYAQIQQDGVQEPINILVPPPDGDIQKSIRAVADRQGQLHLFLSSTCLQHSIARLPLAQVPQEWMKHTNCIGETRFRFGVAEGQDDQLHLVYIGPQGQVFYSRYSPETAQWSHPQYVFEGRESIIAADGRIAVDPTGRIHVVWSEYQAPEFYPPTGVYYAQSTDGGDTWTPPLELAGQGHVEPEIAVTGTDQVHVVWNGSAILTDRYHSYSRDGGRSWSPIYTFSGIPGGILGPPALAVDSANTLHAILSSDKGLFYTSWTERQGWSALQKLWSDTQTGDPAAVVVGGNQLHILFREGIHKIWHMSRTLDAPPVTPDATFTPLPGAPEEEPSAATATPTPTLQGPAQTPRFTDRSGGEQATTTHPGIPILIGVAPAALVIITIIGARQRRG